MDPQVSLSSVCFPFYLGARYLQVPSCDSDKKLLVGSMTKLWGNLVLFQWSPGAKALSINVPCLWGVSILSPLPQSSLTASGLRVVRWIVPT